MSPLKGPGEAQTHDGNPHPIAYILAIIPANWRVPGSKLRIAIVHARWNTVIISALVAGARKSLLQSGVKEENIVIQNVSGSYELPLAVQRIYASSQVESSNNTITSATSAVTGTYGFPRLGNAVGVLGHGAGAIALAVAPEYVSRQLSCSRKEMC